MAYLEKFSEDEKVLLASLPYRAGLWVGAADDSGGAHSGEKERETLEKVIAARSKGMFESAFVHEVLSETFTRRERWPQWAQGLDAVAVDCGRAVEAVTGKLGQRDADAFRHAVMAIATDVAMAYSEFGTSRSLQERFLTFVSFLFPAMGRTKHDFRYPAVNLNVSHAENAALKKLSGFLGIR